MTNLFMGRGSHGDSLNSAQKNVKTNKFKMIRQQSIREK